MSIWRNETAGDSWGMFAFHSPPTEIEPGAEVLEVAEKNLEEPPKPADATEAEFTETAEELVAEAPTEPAPPDEAPGDLGAVPDTGTLGAIDDLYYRRVWQWFGTAWQVVLEGPVRAFGPNCTFEGPTFCSIGPPWIAERWWRYSPSTIGTGGTWDYAGDRQNW
jgi:hypothetical protein